MKSSVQISRGVESLFGTRDENIRLIESGLKVNTQLIDNLLEIEGEAEAVSRAENILEDYVALVREGHVFNNGDLNSYLRVVTEDPEVNFRALVQSGRQRNFGKKMLAPKTVNQRRYLEAIERNDLVLGVGPAGTGKTYLAVAMAVSALLSKRVSRIILTRPAVEAGERLGFLPGTLQEKVDPYLRPLYDALFDMMESEKVDKLLERNTIEVAPIAFMRGRTLNQGERQVPQRRPGPSRRGMPAQPGRRRAAGGTRFGEPDRLADRPGPGRRHRHADRARGGHRRDRRCRRAGQCRAPRAGPAPPGDPGDSRGPGSGRGPPVRGAAGAAREAAGPVRRHRTRRAGRGSDRRVRYLEPGAARQSRGHPAGPASDQPRDGRAGQTRTRRGHPGQRHRRGG